MGSGKTIPLQVIIRSDLGADNPPVGDVMGRVRDGTRCQGEVENERLNSHNFHCSQSRNPVNIAMLHWSSDGGAWPTCWRPSQRNRNFAVFGIELSADA